VRLYDDGRTNVLSSAASSNKKIDDPIRSFAFFRST
jgi:hypothetical protein